MLKVEALQAEEYFRLVSLGPSQVSMKSESSHAGSQAVSVLADRSAVKNDTFRTLATDTQFKGKVKEDMLIRLLEAFIWKHNGASGRPCCRNLALMRSRDTAGELAILLCPGWVPRTWLLGEPLLSQTGMNVLSAPFLYVMPSQLEAFACFSTFIEQSCPLYVQPTLVGVHRGLKVRPEQ